MSRPSRRYSSRPSQPARKSKLSRLPAERPSSSAFILFSNNRDDAPSPRLPFAVSMLSLQRVPRLSVLAYVEPLCFLFRLYPESHRRIEHLQHHEACNERVEG